MLIMASSKRKHLKKQLLILCLLSLGCINAWANSWQERLTQLQDIAQKITHLQLQLKTANRQKASIQAQLKKTEAAVAKLSYNLTKLQQDLKVQQATLAQLTKQLADAEASFQAQQSQLGHELRSVYMLGEVNYLKLMLNQQNPTEIEQTSTYYRYLMLNQLTAIDKVKATIAQIQQKQQAIIVHSQELSALQQQHKEEQQRLLSEKRRRERLVASLADQIDDKAEQLDELSADQRNLENIVAKLKRSEREQVTVQYTGLHGRHPWPLHGPLLALFGTPIEQSELNWKGILIAANDGDAVQSVAPGQVIFANWLKGFGFLIIIEHGNGYMSLYGRNESLYKKVGDSVQSGDLIARAGRSGGFARSGLYFEIRHRGVALNPLTWLS
jgi:septal ring factor EnvC (AmiA/AmiB activator)